MNCIKRSNRPAHFRPFSPDFRSFFSEMLFSSKSFINLIIIDHWHYQLADMTSNNSPITIRAQLAVAHNGGFRKGFGLGVEEFLNNNRNQEEDSGNVDMDVDNAMEFGDNVGDDTNEFNGSDSDTTVIEDSDFVEQLGDNYDGNNIEHQLVVADLPQLVTALRIQVTVSL